MNKRQATRMALAVEASYILLGASTDGITQHLSEIDAQRFVDAQHALAWAMLKRAGFEHPMNASEILARVLGGEEKDWENGVERD